MNRMGDPRRHRLVHAAAPDLHHREGRRRRPERPGAAEPDADQPAVPDLPERDSFVPPGHGAADSLHPGDLADLENERAWTASFGVQRQIGSRASVAIDANINRGQKHGFLDINQPASIPKDVLNAANGATVPTVAAGDRPTPRGRSPVPNGFRRVEILTNEGRFWYQGVRFSGQHRSAPLTLNVVLHAVQGRRSAEPLVRAGGQHRSRAGPRPHRRRHAAQLRRLRHLELPGSDVCSTAGA